MRASLTTAFLTGGVDISSKSEIYRLVRDSAGSGGAVVLYCTEDSEVFDVADRVIVVSRGQIAGSLDERATLDAGDLAEKTAVLQTQHA